MRSRFFSTYEVNVMTRGLVDDKIPFDRDDGVCYRTLRSLAQLQLIKRDLRRERAATYTLTDEGRKIAEALEV